MKFSLREDETDAYVSFYQQFLEEVQSLNRKVTGGWNEVLQQSKYDELQRRISELIDGYTEVIIDKIEGNQFAAWQESNGSLRACLKGYQAGDAADEVCGQIEQKMKDLMQETLKIEKAEIVLTERPMVSEVGLTQVEEVCQNALTEIQDIRSNYIAQAETKSDDNDIYGTLKPLFEGVAGSIEAFYEESHVNFDKMHEFVRTFSDNLRSKTQAEQNSDSKGSEQYFGDSESNGFRVSAKGTGYQGLPSEDTESGDVYGYGRGNVLGGVGTCSSGGHDAPISSQNVPQATASQPMSQPMPPYLDDNDDDLFDLDTGEMLPSPGKAVHSLDLDDLLYDWMTGEISSLSSGKVIISLTDEYNQLIDALKQFSVEKCYYNDNRVVESEMKKSFSKSNRMLEDAKSSNEYKSLEDKKNMIKQSRLKYERPSIWQKMRSFLAGDDKFRPEKLAEDLRHIEAARYEMQKSDREIAENITRTYSVLERVYQFALRECVKLNDQKDDIIRRLQLKNCCESVYFDVRQRVCIICDTCKAFTGSSRVKCGMQNVDKIIGLSQSDYKGTSDQILKEKKTPSDAEMKQYSRITESTSGEKQTKMVNPGFSKYQDFKKYPKEYIAYHENCQRCVVAYEARRRGYDVIAKGRLVRIDNIGNPVVDNENDKVLPFCRFTTKGYEGFASAYKDPVVEQCVYASPEDAVTQIKDKIKSYGNGARLTIAFQWIQGGGHVIVAENRNGEAVFCDPQTGEEGKQVEKYLMTANTDLDKDIFSWEGKYYKRTQFVKVYLLRTDNLEFSELVHECVEPRR